MSLAIPVTMNLRTVDDLSHLCLLLLIQFNVPRSPVVFQSVWLGGTGDGDEALSGNPSQSKL